MTRSTIFSDFLTALRVPHTRNYSDSRYRSMTFRSLFGLSRLLDEYGVANAAWHLPADCSAAQLPTPCLVQKPGNFVILTRADASTVDYIYQGQHKSMPTEKFDKERGDVVLTAEVNDNSREPSFLRHKILDLASSALTVIMVAAVLVVLGYLYISRGFQHSVAVSLLLVVDLAGVAVTSMLMLKSVNVHTETADRVCGILQHGGCDKILAMDASKFFGLFGWSEVGLGYFGVSTVVLLLLPHYIHYLALANLCCLPFTFWSIWYQRFRAHHWCTLCVLTQSLLWCQFFCYAFGGFEHHFSLLCAAPWLLLSCYVAAVLILNKIAILLNRR